MIIIVNDMMKKTYNQPSCLVVELGMRRAAMLTASKDTLGGTGTQILKNGGTGDGTDIGAKGVSDVNVWDKEW